MRSARVVAQRALRAAMIAAMARLLVSNAGAQGVTTAGIRGTVRSSGGETIDAQVSVRHEETGYSVDVRASAGRFDVQGLEPGGPYTVTVRALGLLPRRVPRVYLELGASRELDVVLEPVATRLDAVLITPADSAEHGSRSAGVAAISAALLDRMPATNRDLYDFMRLVPEISTKISLQSAGFSAAGAGLRFNNFLINGASERTLAGGVSSAFGGTRSLPLAAVQEYQVLLSPYDVRYGDFAGALVNAVTKAGTNTFHGSAFAYGRNDRFARKLNGDSSPSFDRVQYGASLSGPIVKDRLQFLIATELQRYTYPAPGPYVGQASGAERPVPVSSVDLARFDAIMRSHGLTAGSPGAVENSTPLANLFTRLDLALPAWASRVVVWDNYGSEDLVAFSRSRPDTFSLSSTLATTVSQAHMTAVQLHTALPRAGGGHNELLVSTRSEYSNVVGALQQPIVRVSVPSAVPSATGSQIILNSGTPELAQSGGFRSGDISLKDNVTLPVGASHLMALGAEAERFRFRRGIDAESYGTWNFASLDDFAAGRAASYDLAVDFGTGNASLVGSQYGGYVQDQWRVSDRLSITAGLRGDLLALDSHAPYNPLVASIFGRRTDDLPRQRVEISPRVGFVLDSLSTSRQRLRGGVGVFTGRYPLAWAQTALVRYGVGNATLTCTASGGLLQSPPAFTPNPAPTACASGTSSTPNLQSDVNLLDRNLRLARVARGSLAYELRIPGDFQWTTEALVSRGLSDFAFQNLNLNAPLGRDFYGRVVYDTIQRSGLAKPTRRSGFREVIDLVNVSASHSYQLTTKLESARWAGMSGSASYAYSRAWDAQTPTRINLAGTVLWATARVLSGRDDDLTATTSSDDIRHRVIVVGNFQAPWRRARTAVSLYYVGESGRPFTYTAYGAGGRGDLNADGSNINDPIYIPRNALDTMEIKFSGDSPGADTSAAARAGREGAQRHAFENFIERTPCLRSQRGQIMARNSCREPWSNTTIASLRQQVSVAPRIIDLQLDVFNVLNLIDRAWGLRREVLPDPARQTGPGLLEHYQQTAGPPQSAQPVFRFDPTRAAWTTNASESGFQAQLAVRFHF
jgi:hypothetical protein